MNDRIKQSLRNIRLGRATERDADTLAEYIDRQRAQIVALIEQNIDLEHSLRNTGGPADVNPYLHNTEDAHHESH